MCVSSRTCNPSQGRSCQFPIQLGRVALVLILPQVNAGIGGMKGLTSMFECLTRTPLPTKGVISPPATGNMNVFFYSYEQRIREVEHSTFTPLVLAATGGLGNEATLFYYRLASLLFTKSDTLYSSTLCWLHCRLSFPCYDQPSGVFGARPRLWTCSGIL